MRVIISPRAEKSLRKLPKMDQLAVARKIRLARDEQVGILDEKLSGFVDIYRVRVGNYRVVYKKTEQELYIVLIGHRREIYQMVKRLLG